VIVPCDAPSTKKATQAMVEHPGPTYLRLGRPKTPVVYTNGCDFQIGKAITVREGTDVTIIANGLMVPIALDAAFELAETGVSARVLDMHTAKPIDEEAIVKAARETRALVVAEEHLAAGGLGSAVAMVTGQTIPVPLAYVNLGDRYAESGDMDGLLEKYGLTASAIVEAVRRVIRR
jgi:transketolase